MTLEFQNFDVKFQQGLETKAQPKTVIPGKWNQLQNCSLCEDGTPRRRDGIAALVASATGNGLAKYNDELLVTSGGTVKSISTGGTDQAKTVSGRLGYVGVSKKEVARSTSSQDANDVATGGGYTCYVWRDYDVATALPKSVNVSLFDETTGTQMIVNTVMRSSSAMNSPRAVFCEAAPGSSEPACFFIFYLDTQKLYCRTIRVTSPATLDAEVTLINSANLLVGQNIDACKFGSINGVDFDTTAAVIYGWDDGTNSVRTIQVKQVAGVPSILGGPTNLFLAADLATLTIAGFSMTRITNSLCAMFVFSSGAGAQNGTAGVTISGAWSVVTAATRFFNDGSAATPDVACHITSTLNSAGNIQVFTDRVNKMTKGVATDVLKSFVVSSVLAVVSGPNTIANSASFGTAGTSPKGPQGPWIAGKAFLVGSNTFLPIWVLENYSLASVATANPRTLNTQNSLFVLDTTGAGVAAFGFAPVVAKALYGSLGIVGFGGLGNNPLVSTPCSTPTLASGAIAYSCTERTLPSFVDGFNLSTSGVVRLTFSPNTTRAPSRVQLGESEYWAGGSVSSFDGFGVVEHGFPLFPEGINVEVVAAGGTMTAGVHQVVVAAEWVDNAGQRHQSAPCLATSVTNVLNDSIKIRVPSLLISQKSGVTLVPYLTQAGGSIFQRAVGPASGGAGTANDTTAALTLLATVTLADTDFAGNELLYTQPSIAPATSATTANGIVHSISDFAVANIAPGPSSSTTIHQNRIFMDVGDQPGQFAFSQQYINNVGLQFSDTFTGTIDVSGGSIVGFSSMDEKLIIFCSKRPFVIYGQGPSADGTGSTYGSPQEIPADVGCSDARSILRMPNGIIFKSLKGWYLMGRDLQVRYIGSGVQDFDADPVSSAVLLADRQECRFGSTSGTQLIYDYVSDVWSTTVYRADSGAAVSNVAVVDAVYWETGGYYSTLSTVHGLNQDTPNVYIDQPGTSPSALAIPTTGRTAWLKMASIGGFQRARKLFLTGTSSVAPKSTLVVSVDFDDGYGQVAPGAYQFTAVYSTVFPTFTIGNTVDIGHHMQRQKCKSVAFTFVDTPTTANPDAGVNFQAMTLDLGLKKGQQKLPAAQSV